MRTIDGDDGDRPVAFDEAGVGIGHGVPPCTSSLRAKRSNPVFCWKKELDGFVASLLAMTSCYRSITQR
jgi:hypothetical protein